MKQVLPRLLRPVAPGGTCTSGGGGRRFEHHTEIMRITSQKIHHDDVIQSSMTSPVLHHNDVIHSGMTSPTMMSYTVLRD